MFAWATLPTPTDLLSAVTVWADPVFSSFLPIAYFVVGIFVAVLAVLLVVHVFRSYFWRLVNHTNFGAHFQSNPLVARLDRWSFRGSKEYKRMLEDK